LRRKQAKAISPLAPEYEYPLYLRAWPKQREWWPACIGISFVTNPDGQRSSTFEAYIEADKFEELAQMMVDADPQKAIRAFGAVLQGVNVETAKSSEPKVTVEGVPSAA